MKNLNGASLVTCIMIMQDDFDRLIKTLYPNTNTEITYELDGITIYVNDENPSDLYTKLAEYYDVKEVQSIHIDDAEYIGVWIAYVE